MNRLSRKRLTFLNLSLAASVILSCVSVVYLFWKLIHASFLEWDGVSSVWSLTGFGNRTQLFFKFPEFRQTFRNNLTYLLMYGAMMPVELVLAVMFSSRFKGSGFVKATIFFSFIINGVGISCSFPCLFSPAGSRLNYILIGPGMEGPIHNWLSDPKIMNYMLTSMSIWRYMDLHIVPFMAGLSSMSKDMMEAAVVDGASVWQRLKYVQLSTTRTVIDSMLFDVINDSLQVLDIPYIMTAGGPSGVSNTSSIYTTDTAFRYNNFGMASSMAVIMILMIIYVQIAQRFIINRLGKGDQYGA